ncbi:N-acetylglucosaminyldiphosphodolichol N-acetylglucosaminyltransferase catalytic subunit alg13 [Aspergillus tubingensis]|uniref:N-acetylglucosaminyldiphosphodolichol N-acetylglucosaminyltransferase catalytic subunit ALG13 n=1 Tax=Aspergillus tubingensis TaxID=5068 RepID=UPI001577DDB7|nr:UDP-N-acetylglucosamine transferase subunit alg13 [Aspergillus tubingensis]GFN15916.1 UDP-N-acetylglucosamine transferase subunit alg13 [Aspergillus tubingensis]GLA65854.1 N-acetylglucosaminyldiphosphodolichol N-acetylglucosaminyltransferase catalytic subunit alg13 [Aspergillus tubingensis]
MPSPLQPNATTKVCFVTVGATASFHLLLQSVLADQCLLALQKLGFTHLLVQYGKDGQALWDEFQNRCPPDSESRHGLEIAGFDFNQAGLDEEMGLARADPSEGRVGGLIISHAGSGSILGALRLGVPLVVVPNPTLKDNHQEELAQELQKQGYVVASNYWEISSALARAEKLRAQMLAWPPVCGIEARLWVFITSTGRIHSAGRIESDTSLAVSLEQ